MHVHGMCVYSALHISIFSPLVELDEQNAFSRKLVINMKPIRGERQRVVQHDWNGNESPSQQQDTIHFLNDDGGIESHTTQRQFVMSCGCVNKPAGGICGDCSASMCTDHFRQCSGCEKPLCPRCSHTIQNKQGMVHLCEVCNQTRNRKRLTRWLLSFFVEFNP